MRRFAMALLFAAAGCSAVRAQDAVKIIVPFAAGGPVDAMARLLAQEMQDRSARPSWWRTARAAAA